MEATRRLSAKKAKEHQPPKTDNPLYAQELENPVSKGIKAYLVAIKERLTEMIALKSVEAMRTKPQLNYYGVSAWAHAQRNAITRGMSKSYAAQQAALAQCVANQIDNAVFDALYSGALSELQRGASPKPLIEPEYVYLCQQVENIIPLLKIIAANGNSFYLLQAEKLMKEMKDCRELFEVKGRSGIQDYDLGMQMVTMNKQMNYFIGNAHANTPIACNGYNKPPSP